MTDLVAAGAVRKMKTQLENPVRYTMLLGEHEIPLNEYLGRQLQLDFNGSNQLHPL